MILSPDYKRFKHSTITGDTLSLPDKRSSIIRTMQGYHSHTNMDDLKRLEKEAQNKEIYQQKTGRTLSVYDRTLLALSYADTVIISGYTARPSVSISHNLILNYLIVFYGLITDHPYNQVNTKPKTYPINEMIPHMVYYSYATKYHKLSSMFITGYQCSNVYINVEKRASMNKDIQ
jgi:hypothetical protein